MNKFSVLLLSILLILISCKSEKDKVQESIKEIDFDEVISNDPIMFSDIFSDYKIIPLETTDNSIFSSIDDIIMLNDTLFIFDRFKSKSVFLFDIGGKFINKICRLGKGPGEYLQVSSFDVDENTRNILLFDWTTKKLIFYDFNGDYLREISFKKYYKSILCTEDKIYLSRPLFETKKGDNLILQMDKNGKNRVELFREKYNQTIPPILEFSRGGDFYGGLSDVKFLKKYDLNIYSIQNQVIKPAIILRTNKYELDENDFIKLQNDPTNQDIKKITAISEFSENDILISFKVKLGRFQYNILSYKNSEKIYCTPRFVDDLTYLHPNMYKISGNKYIGIINSVQLFYIQNSINDPDILIPKSIKEKILSLSDYSNPILVLYEIKESF